MTYYCALIWLILSWSSLSPTFYRNFKVLNICVVPQCQWDKVQSLLISHNILQDLQPCDLSLATHLLHPSNFSLVPLIFDTSAVVIISLSIDLATPLSTHIFFLSYVFTSQGITGDGWQMIASTAIFISYTFYFLPREHIAMKFFNGLATNYTGANLQIWIDMSYSLSRKQWLMIMWLTTSFH